MLGLVLKWITVKCDAAVSSVSAEGLAQVSALTRSLGPWPLSPSSLLLSSLILPSVLFSNFPFFFSGKYSAVFEGSLESSPSHHRLAIPSSLSSLAPLLPLSSFFSLNSISLLISLSSPITLNAPITFVSLFSITHSHLENDGDITCR